MKINKEIKKELESQIFEDIHLYEIESDNIENGFVKISFVEAERLTKNIMSTIEII